MDEIRKLAKANIIGCGFVLVIGVAMLIVLQSLKHESLFIEPDNFSNRWVAAVESATDLESLKKACMFWAEGKDSSSKMVDEALSLVERLLDSMVYGAIFMALMFGYGYFQIFRKLDKLHLPNGSD